MRFNLDVEQLILDPAAHSAGVSDRDVKLATELLAEAGGPFESDTFFAMFLDFRRVAVVRAGPHRPASVQIWHVATYQQLGDPFRLADLFPPDAPDRGELPTRRYEPAPLPRPTVAELARRLGEADMPLVLGATQALLDGVRVRFGPGDATPATLRLIWDLLPDSARGNLWPHTAANARTRDYFDAVITAESVTPSPGVLSAEQCRDYPEGRYELALQTAIERGDQSAADALFARRSSAETLRFAAALLALMLGGALVARLVA